MTIAEPRNNLDDLNLQHFVEAIAQVINAGHNNIAPLGMAGGNFYLHKVEPRVQQVSIRLYCGDPELLITNQSKQFLFYGRFDVALGVEFLAHEYFRIFCLLKGSIPETKESKSTLKVQPDATHTIGFEMMRRMAL